MGRFGTPAEVAGAVAVPRQLGAPRYITGTTARRRRRLPGGLIMPTLPPHYHVGIVVPDVAAARVRLTEQLGVTWGPIFHLDEVAYRDGDGTDLSLPTTICYSIGEPCLELIEEMPGHGVGAQRALEPAPRRLLEPTLLAATAPRRSPAPAARCSCAAATATDAPVSFAYHRDDDLGVRFELVDATMRDAMSFLFEPDPGTA